MIKKIFLSIFILSTIASFFWACENEEMLADSSARLSFSTDKLNFDTVFTTIGSATRRIMVYNRNSKTIRITKTQIEGLSSQSFKMNFDGISGSEVSNIEIQANDSAYLFVQVTVDPTNKNSPLVINDNIVFTLNGAEQKLELEAWGQDVHLLKDVIFKGSFEADKPYLIYGTCLVDVNDTVKITAGATLYFHNNSRMWVAGTLLSEGTLAKPVILRSDRLDYVLPKHKYDKFPGQWDGVYFMPSSKGNKMTYTTISNTITGILMNHYNVADTFKLWVNSADWVKKYEKFDSTELELNNCKITTASYAGMLAYNSIVKAVNTQITNCDQFGVVVLLGGSYDFVHCTLANYSKSRKEGALVFFQNTFQDAQKKLYTGEINHLYFNNSVIYGSGSNEVIYKGDYNTMNFKFQNCLLRIDNNKHPVSEVKKFDRVLISQQFNPGFVSLDSINYTYNFNVTKNFLGKDKGKKELGAKYPSDYLGNARDNAPDCGAYEFK